MNGSPMVSKIIDHQEHLEIIAKTQAERSDKVDPQVRNLHSSDQISFSDSTAQDDAELKAAMEGVVVSQSARDVDPDYLKSLETGTPAPGIKTPDAEDAEVSDEVPEENPAEESDDDAE